MQTIEIDFEVFKALTMGRKTESMTCNDVIRNLLGLNPTEPQKSIPTACANDWICKGVRFPVGTEFRAHYKGITHQGKVESGGLIVKGAMATSPSDAARLITNNNVNGWNFWECRFPGDTRWRLIRYLRNER